MKALKTDTRSFNGDGGFILLFFFRTHN